MCKYTRKSTCQCKDAISPGLLQSLDVDVMCCVMLKKSPMVTVEKFTEGLDGTRKYTSSTLYLLYDGVNFMTKNNVILKILDFQNDDMC